MLLEYIERIQTESLFKQNTPLQLLIKNFKGYQSSTNDRISNLYRQIMQLEITFVGNLFKSHQVN